MQKSRAVETNADSQPPYATGGLQAWWNRTSWPVEEVAMQSRCGDGGASW